MCEKPMAKNYAEAQKMVRLGGETGRILEHRIPELLPSRFAVSERNARLTNWERSTLQKPMHRRRAVLPGCILK